jgi:ubiquinone/menaquinone biosynthesis C-methylase UbiE
MSFTELAMLASHPINLTSLVDSLKAAAESSRLRILVLLSRGDLTVSDLTEILGQSQPRVSRHLKLLLEADLIHRYQEGSWAYFGLSDGDWVRDFLSTMVARLDAADPTIERDLERLDAVKQRRQSRASDYFSANAVEWDRLRSLHAPDKAVESVLTKIVGKTPFQSMLDLGTGTGRMLELFAPLYRRGTGVDLSREMLAVARANLDKAGIAQAQVRLGDLYAPPVERDSFDLITMHQVLHYLEEPALAIREAARLLRPAGRLAIIDFAPHALDFLRDAHAHVRLGISDAQIGDWLAEAGLDLEASETVPPDAESDQRLTVRIWLARDPRIQIASPSQPASQKALA